MGKQQTAGDTGVVFFRGFLFYLWYVVEVEGARLLVLGALPMDPSYTPGRIMTGIRNGLWTIVNDNMKILRRILYRLYGVLTWDLISRFGIGVDYYLSSKVISGAISR